MDLDIASTEPERIDKQTLTKKKKEKNFVDLNRGNCSKPNKRPSDNNFNFGRTDQISQVLGNNASDTS